MSKYKVEILRTAHGYTTVEVEADSEMRAIDIAKDRAGDQEYNTSSSEYSVIGVRKILNESNDT
jgi:hypothetical protein